jgi:flagellar biosynthesis regulator FlbT
MANKSTMSGRVRFIMLEADIADGNISEIAQAISGAIRPAPVTQRIVQPAQALIEGASVRVPKEAELSQHVVQEQFLDEEAVIATPKRTTPSKNRKYPVPQVLDLDLTSGDVPWEAFAKQKNPTETSKKFLVVAAWLKEHRGIDSITADHVYTSFKMAGWGTGLKDFGEPFRKLKAQGWVGSSKPGTFEINHVGLNVVSKMGAS